MNEDIGVSSNGRGEMSIEIKSQRIVLSGSRADDAIESRSHSLHDKKLYEFSNSRPEDRFYHLQRLKQSSTR